MAFCVGSGRDTRSEQRRFRCHRVRRVSIKCMKTTGCTPTAAICDCDQCPVCGDTNFVVYYKHKRKYFCVNYLTYVLVSY